MWHRAAVSKLFWGFGSGITAGRRTMRLCAGESPTTYRDSQEFVGLDPDKLLKGKNLKRTGRKERHANDVCSSQYGIATRKISSLSSLSPKHRTTAIR
jgi:hypothetical protein